MKFFTTICMFFLVIYIHANDLKIKLVMPEKVQSGSEFEVTVNISKKSIDGFARMEFEIPDGFKVIAVENSGAAFSYTPPKLKYIWMTIPNKPEFEIKFKIKSAQEANGIYEIKGVFSYLYNEQTKTSKTNKTIIIERDNIIGPIEKEKEIAADAAQKNSEGIQKQDHNRNSEALAKTISKSNELTFHVQVGAYKTPPSDSQFARVKELIKTVSEDGLTRFFSGSFDNLIEAQVRKNELNQIGLNEVFVVAYQSGKRVSIPLSKTTNTLQDRSASIKNNTVLPPSQTSMKKQDIKFKVQVGSFKSEVPVNVLSQLIKLEELEVQKSETGITSYFSGSFNDYNSAMQRKNELINSGLKEAFIVAFLNNEVIPIRNALELLK
jgi:cell division protein FtsN